MYICRCSFSNVAIFCAQSYHFLPFKGFDARSFGPISFLVVLSRTIGICPSRKTRSALDCYAATCFLVPVKNGLVCPFTSISHVSSTNVAPDRQASRLDRRLQSCHLWLHYVASVKTTCFKHPFPRDFSVFTMWCSLTTFEQR